MRAGNALVAGVTVLVGIALAAAAAGAPPTQGPGQQPGSKAVVLVDQPFLCEKYRQPLDLDLVRVTHTEAYPRESVHSAINLGNRGGGARRECTGRIGRLEVDTVVGDAVKVGKGAHDLVIQSARLHAHGKRSSAIHQDCIQFQGGFRVTFRRLYCKNETGGAGWFNAPVRGSTNGEIGLQDAVLEQCFLRASDGRSWTWGVKRSVRSGLRDCVVVAGTKNTRRAIAIDEHAVSPVNERNRILSPGRRLIELTPWLRRTDLALESQAVPVLIQKAAPRAGRTLTVTIVAGALIRGREHARCSAVSNGRTLPATRRELEPASLACTWRIPARWRGRLLKVTVAIVADRPVETLTVLRRVR